VTGLGILAGLLGGAGLAAVVGPRRGSAGLAGRVAGRGGVVPHGRAFGGRGSGADRGDARLAGALVEVAALLRAGAAPAEAWSRVLGVPVVDRVPTVAQLATIAGGARGARGAPKAPLEAVVAAALVADDLGAPLAGILDQVAAAIAAQAEAAAEVDAALAGPRSSARVLGWLPALGLLLGAALGADPIGELVGGGPGTAAGVAGLALVVLGRWWSGTLLRRVERAGSAP
jgi:tight adherence protein B